MSTKSSPVEPITRQHPLESRLMVNDAVTFSLLSPETVVPITIREKPKPDTAPLESAPTPLDALKPQPMLPLEEMPQNSPPPILSADGFGELAGAPDATALHSLSGDKPMQAAKAEHDQPYISRDPSGRSRPAETPAKVDEGDSDKTGVAAERGEPAPLIKTAVAINPEPAKRVSAPPAQDRPLDQPANDAAREPEPKVSPAVIASTDTRFGPRAVPAEEAVSPKPEHRKPDAPPLIAMAQPMSPPAQAAPAAAPLGPSTPSGSPDAGTSPSSTADPAPITDSESDPFSVMGAAEFRAGRVQAKFGRKVKTVKPRLTLSGSYDLFTAAPAVVLRVRADETGKVRDVKIVKSSGSRDIDQPCQLAMYEWWFEPPRDKNGNAQPAEMLWTITFRSF